jgi:hypothetical protein
MSWDFIYFVLAVCPLILCAGYFEYRKARLLHVAIISLTDRALKCRVVDDVTGRF